MSIEDVARKTVEGMVGKALLASSLALIMGGVGFLHNEFDGIHKEIVDHSRQLSGISQKLDDLILADQNRAVMDENRAALTDASINRLTDTEQQHSIAIARAEEELQALNRAPPKVIERVIPDPPIHAIGNALSHIFPGLRPHHHWRGREGR